MTRTVDDYLLHNQMKRVPKAPIYPNGTNQQQKASKTNKNMQFLEKIDMQMPLEPKKAKASRN